MTNKDFDDFVTRQTSKEKEPKVNWKKRRKEWLNHLSNFYQKVEEFLNDYVVTGQISINYSVKSIIEDGLGEYEVNTATIKIGPSEIKLEPIGTNVIGAKGRVDMNGLNGTVKFVLVDQEASEPRTSVPIWIRGEKPPPLPAKPKCIKWTWKISTPPPYLRYIELEPESFFDAVMEVANG